MTGDALSFPDGPRVELDRRIADLVDAATTVLGAQGRLRALLAADHAIAAQLDLDEVLRTIAESARAVTAARSATLGVLDEYGSFERVLRTPSAISGDEEARAPREGDLVVQLRVDGLPYAELRLRAEPGVAFTEEDEQLVQWLATTAGFAVEHAQLYRATRQREALSAASAEFTAALLAGKADDALRLVAERVGTIFDADGVFVALSDDRAEALDVVAVHGADPDGRRGTRVRLEGSLVERAIQAGTSSRWDARQLREMDLPTTKHFDAVMVLLLRSPERLLGSVSVSRGPGGRAFAPNDLAVASDFVSRAGIALELHRAREGQGRVRLFEDRGRIARDLHDRVIQQLFATGMQLQGVLGTLPDGRNAERIDAAITGLDASIAQIRRIVFTLSDQGRDPVEPTSRHRFLDLIGELASSMSVEPSVTFAGPVEAVLRPDVTEDLLAVVSEGVANAVRHGGATEVSVRIAAEPGEVVATVTSNGTAMDASARSSRRSGLANLEQRAAAHGGSMRLRVLEDRLVLEWRVPLPARRPGSEA